QPNPDEFFGLM
uniref:Substance P-like peptide 1 n=1 Tax=Pseudophryne guentheri TaxID=30349 RepID=TKN4_PSEGU|nr:RecName: Full=Substance P-like peptide 1; AltName: Full=PG-SPI [Pseudophryne guentheri]